MTFNGQNQGIGNAESAQQKDGLLILSDFLYSGNLSLEQIQAKCRVENLPDAKGVEHHPESYSGYINVNEREDPVFCNLFFWFFPAEENRDEGPFILWLNGGPGSSSMKGLFAENGAYQINSKNELEKRKTYLSQNASVLYVDSPVGAGFSHTNGGAKRRAQTHDDVSRDLLSFLDQFFHLFPEFLNRDFYISSESYGGKYVPSLGLKIHERNHFLDSEKKQNGGLERGGNARKSTEEQVSPSRVKKIKLVGMTIGCPFTDPINQQEYGDFLYGASLINEQQRKIMLEEERKLRESIAQERWSDALKLTFNLILATPGCLFTQFTGFPFNFNTLQPTAPPSLRRYIQYLEKPGVRAAIHAGKSTTFFDFNPKITVDLTNVFFKPELAALIFLLEQDYKILIYASQLDILIPPPTLKKLAESIRWTRNSSGDPLSTKTCRKILSLDETPRTPWKLDLENTVIDGSKKVQVHEEEDSRREQVVGYIQREENLTFIELLNAGHLAFVDVPEVCMKMMFRFLGNSHAHANANGNGHA